MKTIQYSGKPQQSNSPSWENTLQQQEGKAPFKQEETSVRTRLRKGERNEPTHLKFHGFKGLNSYVAFM